MKPAIKAYPLQLQISGPTALWTRPDLNIDFRMTFYTHTAGDKHGNQFPKISGKWQPLALHLRKVARHANELAAPFNLVADAELAGLLHDLGKYAGWFQLHLRHPASIHGINHWTAGTSHAASLPLCPTRRVEKEQRFKEALGTHLLFSCLGFNL